MGIYLLERGFAEDEAIGVGMGYAVGTQFELAGTLFARNVEDTLFGHVEYGLQHQGALADAGLATDEDK